MFTKTLFTKTFALTLSLSLAGAGILGCSTVPKTEDAKENLSDKAQSALSIMQRKDDGLRRFLDNAYGYVVFPDAGKGGLIVGGAYGQGEVYEQGKFIGYASMTQGTIGLQGGGQTFDELIVFQNEAAMSRFKKGEWALAANVSAVALKAGASAAAQYKEGVSVFVYSTGGLMAEAAIGGQKFTFKMSKK